MQSNRFLAVLSLLTRALAAAWPASAQQQHSFGIEGNQFVLDGKPFQIPSGEMHYARIPRAYWRARMLKSGSSFQEDDCSAGKG